jgi:hypothetical protein
MIDASKIKVRLGVRVAERSKVLPPGPSADDRLGPLSDYVEQVGILASHGPAAVAGLPEPPGSISLS